MQNAKPVQFEATAGSYFLLTIVSLISAYIPLFGWAFAFNYAGEWFAEHAHVNGRAIKYQAGYGETLKFIFVNSLLIFITFGIYSFWFYPKAYRYMADHVSYTDEAAGKPVAAPVYQSPVAEPAQPVNQFPPQPPQPPLPPTTPTPQPPAGQVMG